MSEPGNTCKAGVVFVIYIYAQAHSARGRQYLLSWLQKSDNLSFGVS